MSELRALWESHQQDVLRVVALKEGRVDELVKFTNRDLAWHLPIGYLVANIVNHGTHHRSELAALLTAAGMSPPPLDFVDFLYERRKADLPVG